MSKALAQRSWGGPAGSPAASPSGDSRSMKELQEEVDRLQAELASKEIQIKSLSARRPATGGAQPPNAPGPMTALVLTGDGKGDCFEIIFPWELNNTDYLRRVLASVTFALRGTYREAVTTGGCKVVVDNRGKEVQADEIDCYYITKHMQANENIKHYAKVLGMPPEVIKKNAGWLKTARNKLAHESHQGVPKDYVMEGLGLASQLATAARCNFAQTNLMRLRERFNEHSQSKASRMPALP